MFSILSIALLVFISRLHDVPVSVYVSLLSFSTAGIFILLRKSAPPAAVTVLAVAVIIHVIALFGVAAFEDDYFRFIWDGYQTSVNGTPYGIVPADYFGNSNVPPQLTNILVSVNNPQVPTIYGPVLQFIFAAAYFIGGTDPIALRVIFALINLVLVGLLLKSTSPANAALYAWCPLVVAEIVIHVHPDGIMAALLLGGVIAVKRYPALAGFLFGMAAGTKIVALAAWPLLARAGIRSVVAAIVTLILFYLLFAVQGSGVGFDSTRVFATQWYFNPFGFAALSAIAPPDIARLLASMTGIAIIMLLHARTRGISTAPLATIFAIVLLVAPAVNSWYILWILPFAINSRNIWPFVAASVIPLSYLTGLNLDDYSLEAFAVHPWAWIAELALISLALFYDWRRYRKQQGLETKVARPTPINDPNIAIIIPALNEAESIRDVVLDIQNISWSHRPLVIVVDNGSTDETARLAEAAGAVVVREEQRGYGAACLAGIAILPAHINIVLFMDADGSDVPQEALTLVEPVIAGHADMVIGSRTLGIIEAGAMTVPQRFGNWLATRLIRVIWGKNMTDLGPFRAIRYDALDRLAMADRDYGWTVEMQVKAVHHNMRIEERPADYRKRIGVSKISGTIKGVIRAGTKILYVIGREAYCR